MQDAATIDRLEWNPGPGFPASTLEDLLARLRHAAEGGDTATIVDVSRAITQAHPGHAAGHLACAEALMAAGRHDQADAMLQPFLSAKPPHPDIMIRYALSASSRSDWNEALRRWDQVLAELPELQAAGINRALALRALGRLDEADDALCRIRLSLPDNYDVSYHWAINPLYQQAWTTAIARWTEVRSRWPEVPTSHSFIASALRELGRLDEAKALLAVAEQRFAGSFEIEMEQAQLSGRSGDWPDALRRWDALRERHPGHPQVEAKRKEAQMLAAYAQSEQDPDAERGPLATTGPAHPAGSGRDMSILFDLERLLQEFESLGSDCEVGLLQRQFNVEPLGLLRWGGPVMEQLIAALRARFEGLGAPGTLRLENKRSEYLMHDDVYGMLMHTFIPVDPAQEDKILKQLGRRMTFLKRILFDMLAGGTRILVFKDVLGSDRSRIMALHEELRRIGPATLLVVQAARGGCRAADVERLTDGLFLGFVSAFGNKPLNRDGSWNIPVQEWINMFRIVYASAR